MSKHPIPIEPEQSKVSWDAQPITFSNIQSGLLTIKEEWKELSMHTRNKIISTIKNIFIITSTLGIAEIVGAVEASLFLQAIIVGPVVLTYLTRELIKQKREKLPKMWRYSVTIQKLSYKEAKEIQRQDIIEKLNRLPISTFQKI